MVEEFLVDVLELDQARKHRAYNPFPLRMQDEDWEAYRSAERCHYCNSEFSQTDKARKKVRDQDHFTGNFSVARPAPPATPP